MLANLDGGMERRAAAHIGGVRVSAVRQQQRCNLAVPFQGCDVQRRASPGVELVAREASGEEQVDCAHVASCSGVVKGVGWCRQATIADERESEWRGCEEEQQPRRSSPTTAARCWHLAQSQWHC